GVGDLVGIDVTPAVACPTATGNARRVLILIRLDLGDLAHLVIGTRASAGGATDVILLETLVHLLHHARVVDGQAIATARVASVGINSCLHDDTGRRTVVLGAQGTR